MADADTGAVLGVDEDGIFRKVIRWHETSKTIRPNATSASVTT